MYNHITLLTFLGFYFAQEKLGNSASRYNFIIKSKRMLISYITFYLVKNVSNILTLYRYIPICCLNFIKSN